MKIDSSSNSILRQLNETNKNISKTFEKLATGKRVNSAKDDPSALARATALESAIRSSNSVNQGISITQGALETKSSGLTAQLESLQNLRELAVQSANGTVSDSDRANLQQQYDQQLQNIDATASQTSFNGQDLIKDTSTSALDIAATGVATQSGAEDAIESIDSAISQVQSEIASTGANQNALEYQSNANSVAAENLVAAKSNAIDADLAEVTSQLQQQQVQQQAQLAVIKAQSKNEKKYASGIFGKS